jgi:glycosyltransferase involved in cell wall biosynthesis
MKCLWLTLADPDPPMNGQFLYSSGLIRSAEAAGMDLDVVGFSLPDGIHRDGQKTRQIRWHLAPHQPRAHWLALISRLPSMTHRTRTAQLRRVVQDLLCHEGWEAIIFDSLELGWALSLIVSRFRGPQRRPKLVYLAHNHEETVAWRVAQDDPNLIRRMIKWINALKMTGLELSVSRHSSVITSNTPEDCDKFRKRWPGKTVEFLPPGYSGSRTHARRITETVPRCAVIVGSFDWPPKRQSLEQFLCAAAVQFARAGVELSVVGQADESYLDRLRKLFVGVRFTGKVDDVAEYMKKARIAVVPDTMGGFKLKGLDYIFNHLPIFAISGSLPGMPLRHVESAEFFPDHEKLAQGVIRSIDDCVYLNTLQDRAYRACCNDFKWDSIGRRLYYAIARPEQSDDENGAARLSEIAADQRYP